MLALVRVGAVCLVAVAARAQVAGPLEVVRRVDAAGGMPRAIAVNARGSAAAWVDEHACLHWTALPPQGPPQQQALPPGDVEQLAFVDEGTVDVWSAAVPGAPPAAFRYALAANARIVGPAAGAAPRPPELEPFRARLREGLWRDGRKLLRVATSGDGAAVLAQWSTGHLTWHRDGRSGELVDADCHDLALSRNGRWLVAHLTTRVVVAAVDGDVVAPLPVEAGTVAAVSAGAEGGDVLVVTAAAVQRWDAAQQQLLQRIPLPVRAERVDVRQASAGAGGTVAVRVWLDGAEPWLGLLDLRNVTWRTFGFVHGSMAWSFDGETLLVGAGGPFDAAFESDRVRLVPRVRGAVRDVVTRGYQAVTALPGGAFFGVDSVGQVHGCDGRRAQARDAEVWGPAVALTADWLLVGRDTLQLRTLAGDRWLPVLPCEVERLAIARPARRVAAAAGARLYVLAWPTRLPRARKAGTGAGRTW